MQFDRRLVLQLEDESERIENRIILLHTDEPIPSTIYHNGQLCKTKEFAESLGLIIDKNLKYKNHLNNAISKGQKSWNSIQLKSSKRWGLTFNPQTFLFKTIIQPQLIYASSI